MAIEVEEDDEGDHEEDEEEEEASEDEEEHIEELPKRRVVPCRSTRGKRLRKLGTEEAQVDKEFWNHETWKEELDEEWSTEDEAHYKDEFESDFNETSESDDDEEDEGGAEDDKKRRPNKGVYVDPRAAQKRSAGRGGAKKAAAGTEGPQRQAKRRRVDWSKMNIGGGRYREMSQSEHLALAARTEQANLKSLIQLEEQENWKKMMKEQVAPSVWQGPMQLWISWGSNRLIEAEEERKATAGAKKKTAQLSPIPRDGAASPAGHEELAEVYSREMVFFVDFSDPPKSQISDTYFQKKPPDRVEKLCAITGKPAKYFDPLLKKYYCNSDAFKILRQRYHEEHHRATMRRLAAATRRMAQLQVEIPQAQQRERTDNLR